MKRPGVPSLFFLVVQIDGAGPWLDESDERLAVLPSFHTLNVRVIGYGGGGSAKEANGMQTIPPVELPGLAVLGCGYDIDGKYADIDSAITPLVDLTKCDKKVINSPSGKVKKKFSVPSIVNVFTLDESTTESIQGSDADEYSRNLSVKATIGGSYSEVIATFKGSATAAFSESTANDSSFSFTTLSAYTKMWKLTLPSPDLLKDYLDPVFQENLENMDPYLLLSTYGTHYLTEIVVGGRGDFHLAVNTSQYKDTQSISADLNLALTIGKFDASSGISVAANQARSNLLSNSKTSCHLVGGDSFMSGQTVTRAGTDIFPLWQSTVPNAPTLCDFTPSTLVPIWKLASDARAGAIEAAFQGQYIPTPLTPADAAPVPRLVVRTTKLLRLAGESLQIYGNVFRPFKRAFWFGHSWQPAGPLTMAREPTVGWWVSDNVTDPVKGDALKAPTGFTMIPGTEVKTQPDLDDGYYVSAWAPTPPAGYVVLGCLYRMGYSVPSQGPSAQEQEGFMCLRQDLAFSTPLVMDPMCLKVPQGLTSEADLSCNIGFDLRINLPAYAHNDSFTSPHFWPSIGELDTSNNSSPLWSFSKQYVDWYPDY